MKSILLGLVFSADLLSLSASAAIVVRSETNPSNGHRYHLLHGDDGWSGIDWIEAETKAIQLGGHLVTINDSTEHAWILGTFPGNFFQDSTDYYVWIGLNDAASEGVFEWASGEPVTYLNWYPGEPNDALAGEDHVHIYNFASGLYQWNDLSWQTQYFYSFPMAGLVEVAAVPESSVSLIGAVVLVALLFGHMIVRRKALSA